MIGFIVRGGSVALASLQPGIETSTGRIGELASAELSGFDAIEELDDLSMNRASVVCSARRRAADGLKGPWLSEMGNVQDRNAPVNC